jgi:hypothetical protein
MIRIWQLYFEFPKSQEVTSAAERLEVRRIRGYHSGDYGEPYFLGRNAVKSDKN